jgi:hypothetical protein
MRMPRRVSGWPHTAIRRHASSCIAQHRQAYTPLVALTVIPLITTVGRTVIDPAHRRSCCQMLGITAHGARLIEKIVAQYTLTEHATPGPVRLSWNCPWHAAAASLS